MDSSDGCACVFRHIGECYADPCIIQRQHFGGGSVMVWGGISFRGRTQFVVVQGNLTGVRYRDEIIQLHVLPFVQGEGRRMMFQHVAHVVTDILAQQNVNVLPWTAVSPDLSPIEHVRDEMEIHLCRQRNQPLMLDQLAKAVVNIWNSIPQAFLTNLITYMHCRCQVCLNANDGHTYY